MFRSKSEFTRFWTPAVVHAPPAPSWWKKPLSELPSTFNARAETVAADVPIGVQGAPLCHTGIAILRVDRRQGLQDPHYFSAPSGEPLALAGLWETWRDPESDARVDSATIIVGQANEWMSRFHHRMPVILDWRDARAWMGGADPG